MQEEHVTAASSDPNPSWTPRQPFAVQVSCALAQDLFSAKELTLKWDSPSPVALFPNPFAGGQIDALVIAVSGDLQHLRRGPDGWVTDPIRPTAAKAKEVVVVVAPDGVVWSLHVDTSDSLVISCLDAGGWTVKTSLPRWKDLKVVYTGPSPMRIPVVYGAQTTNARALKFARWGATGAWSDNWAELPPGYELKNRNAWLYPGADDSGALGAPLRFRLILDVKEILSYFEVKTAGTVKSQSWAVTHIGDWDGMARRPYISGSPVDRGFFGMELNGSVWDLMGYFHSTNQGPYFTTTFAPIRGVWVFEQTAAFLDANLLVHIYGVTDKGELSVIHQTGWKQSTGVGSDGGVTPTWTQGINDKTKLATDLAIPIDSDVKSVFIDPYPDTAPTLLVRYGQGGLMLRTQDLATGRWWSEPVRLASGQAPVAVTSYRTQLTVVDAIGAPVPRHKIKITAKTRVQIKVGGSYRFLTPDAPTAELTTDAYGRVSFSTPADGLTTPSLVVSAPEIPNGVVIKPDDPVQGYLSGTGSLPLRPKLTGDVLKQSNLVPSWDGKPSADQVVATIGDFFGMAGKGPAPTPARAGYIVQTFDPTRHAYTAFASHAELQTAIFGSDLAIGYEGFFDNLKQSLDDLLVGIRSGAAKIAQYAVDTVNNTVSFFVRVGTDLVLAYRFVIKSVREAADAVMAVFNNIGVAVDKAVDWLRSLLDLGDVWETKSALEGGLGYFPQVLQDRLRGPLGLARVRLVIEENRGKAKTALTALKSQYAGQRLHDFPGWQQDLVPRTHGAQTVLYRSPQGVVVTRGDIDGPEGNWFFDALKPFGAVFPEGPMFPALEPLLQKIVTAFSGNEMSFLTDFKERFVALFDPKNPDTLGRVVIDVLLDLLIGIVDKAFDAALFVSEVMFQLVDETIAVFRDLLATQITLKPIVDLVTWVYNEAHKNVPNPPPPPPLTIAGLVSLSVAFPTTLGWKIIAGDPKSKLFPGGRLPRPGDAASAESLALGISDGGRCLIAGGLIQVGYTFLDIVNDVGADNVSSVSAIVLEALMPILIWPTPSGIPGDCPELTTVQLARWCNWAPGVVYCAADAFFFGVGWKKKKSLARDADTVGKMIISSFGILNLIAGVWESIADPDISGAGIAANVLSPLSPACQLLRVFNTNPEVYAVLLGSKLIVNVISDAGGGIARGLAAS